MSVISKMDNNTEKDPLLSSTSNKIDQTKKTDGAQKQLSSDHRQITRLITVEPVVILVAFCWTSQSPLLEQYGYAKLAAKANVSILPSEEENNCNANESDPIYEIQQKIQSQTSDFVMILMLISSLPNVIVLPVFMFLSDRFGRKPILLFNLSCMLIGYIELLVFVQLDESLEMMYISAATFGLFGTQTLLSTSLAYLADCSDRVDRSFKMIIFEVCTSIASILSNISTGFLIKYVDIIFPFLSFVVCTSVALLYTLFLLPESLRKTHHVKQERSWGNFIAPYKASIAVFFKDNGTNRRWKIQLTAAVNAVVTGNHVGLLILLPLYLLNSPICFDSLSIAIVIVEIYFFRTIGSLIIPKVFKNLLSDTSLIIVSLISDMIFLAIIGFLPYAVWILFGKFAPHYKSPNIRKIINIKQI